MNWFVPMPCPKVRYSPKTLQVDLFAPAFRRRVEGRKFAKSQIEALLKNPFYYGEMHTKYGIFDHAYEPLISRALFEQVQAVTDRYHKTPFQHGALPFVLS